MRYTDTQKRALYESIMRDVAISIQRHLNEYTTREILMQRAMYNGLSSPEYNPYVKSYGLHYDSRIDMVYAKATIKDTVPVTFDGDYHEKINVNVYGDTIGNCFEHIYAIEQALVEIDSRFVLYNMFDCAYADCYKKWKNGMPESDKDMLKTDIAALKKKFKGTKSVYGLLWRLPNYSYKKISNKNVLPGKPVTMEQLYNLIQNSIGQKKSPFIVVLNEYAPEFLQSVLNVCSMFKYNIDSTSYVLIKKVYPYVINSYKQDIADVYKNMLIGLECNMNTENLYNLIKDNLDNTFHTIVVQQDKFEKMSDDFKRHFRILSLI